VELNGKWGFIDKNGEFAIKPKFDDIWDFSEGLAKVKLNGKYGFIDKNGDFVIKPKFDDIGY
ncbi:WG repeat-containing protein, partial [Campylobacter coli]|nr:WG repeat-containing protein [Campylobacter coli]